MKKKSKEKKKNAGTLLSPNTFTEGVQPSATGILA